jgi:protein-tyrosine phosphatase
MAQVVLRQKVQDAGLGAEFKIESAGTNALANGKGLDARAALVLSKRNYKINKPRVRKVATQDFDVFDLILAMDTRNMDALLGQCPPHQRTKLAYFLKFAPELGLSEVPDPYFGNLAGFERVLDLCEAGASGVIKTLVYTA